tara:strand:+ start:182 stop:1006 length:825 start_codon:yes stop_codon:yes gene_type:complete
MDQNKLGNIKKKPSDILRSLFKNFFRLMPFNREYSRTIAEIIFKKLLRDNKIRDVRPSLIYSFENLNISDYLISVISDSVKVAHKLNLKCGKTNLYDSKFLNQFPGEHYRILSAIVNVINAKEVVEIGTYTGLGTLSIKEGLSLPGKVTTYDLISWKELGFESHFKDEDFKDGIIKQILGDLSDDDFFQQNIEILNSADIIFMDAPKDDIFEYKMIKQFLKLEPKIGKLLIIDDIKFINMIDLWRSIKSPKIDLSSFGHWSGTGVVDISDGLKL